MNEENMKSGEFKLSGIVIETVTLTVNAPKGDTLVTCKDPSGFDQFPIPEAFSTDDRYAIARITVDGVERDEVYWREYSTLVYYSDVRMKTGDTYTVFGRLKAAPGYIFTDPVNLIINGEEVSPEVIEDYTLEGDSFTFYFDIKAL
ncbi:MAG: hypothetical protein IJI44_00195 [Erysipelotrichaceae bacterium]|nr:hypothetical protein [Erysipelotrichaceae bacterium]